MHARLKTPWDSHSIKTSENACYTNTLFQICFFNAAAAKTFTTVLAGLALTFISLPNMTLVPALVAGFVRVLIRHKPGMANTPVFFTSFVAMLTKLLSTSEQVFDLNPCSVAMVFNKLPFDMALAPAFMDPC